jgi:hypothetical protein
LFDYQFRMLLDALAQPDNIYTGKDWSIRPSNLWPPSSAPRRRGRGHPGDSGLSAPAFYEACDERDFYFVVRLKTNPCLGHLAEAEVHDWRAAGFKRSKSRL